MLVVVDVELSVFLFPLVEATLFGAELPLLSLCSLLWINIDWATERANERLGNPHTG